MDLTVPRVCEGKPLVTLSAYCVFSSADLVSSRLQEKRIHNYTYQPWAYEFSLPKKNNKNFVSRMLYKDSIDKLIRRFDNLPQYFGPFLSLFFVTLNLNLILI